MVVYSPENLESAVVRVNELEREIDKLRWALRESVNLQSHYAKLLNEYDGGFRTVFASADEWLARLEYLEKRRKRTKPK